MGQHIIAFFQTGTIRLAVMQTIGEGTRGVRRRKGKNYVYTNLASGPMAAQRWPDLGSLVELERMSTNRTQFIRRSWPTHGNNSGSVYQSRRGLKNQPDQDQLYNARWQ